MVDIIRPNNLDYNFKKETPEINKPDNLNYNFISNVSSEQTAGAGTYAAALATEVAIAESIKMGGTAVGGPIGYVVGGLAGGAVGSIAAQRLINPDGEISIGRVIADSFINLVPGSKITKGAKTVKDVVKRTAGVGGAIGVGGVTVEKGFDEGRLPTIEELGVAGLTSAALGGSLGFTGARFNKVYNKIGGMTPAQIDTLLDPKTSPDVIKNVLQDVDINDVKKIGSALMRLQKEYNSNYEKTFAGDAIKRLKVNFLDDKKLALDLQQQSGGGQFVNPKGLFKVDGDEKDYYLESVLREAITAKQLEGYIKFYKETNDIAIDIGKRAGIDASGSDINFDVNQYLRAKHSIKYNKENAFSFGEKVGKQRDEYTTVLEERDVINKRTGKPIINPATGKPYRENVKVRKYSSVDGASGMSTEKAKDIVRTFEQKGLQNTYKVIIDRKKFLSEQILETAKRGGLISDSLYKELREKYPDYVPLNRVMPEDFSDINTTSFLQEVRGTGIRSAKGSERDVVDLDQNLMDNLTAMTIKANANIANQKFLKMIESPENINVAGDILKINKQAGVRFKGAGPKEDPNTLLTIYDKGEKTLLKFKDQDLAMTFKGMPRTELSFLPKLAYTIARGYTSLRAQVLTRYNVLEFPFSNKIRDMQETLINNAAKFGVKKASSAVNPLNLNKSAMKIIAKKNLGKPASNAEEQRLYDLHDQFKEDGGSAGGLALYSRDDVRTQIEKISKDQFKGGFKQFGQKINKFVDEYNEVFEDSSRFAAYVQGIESGKTRKQAALAARNASFDPTRQGRKGQLLRAGYLFANPAIQGTRNIFRSFIQKPKLFYGLMGGLITEEFIRHQYNKSVDENYIEKLQTRTGGNYRTNKNFVIVTGVNDDGTLKYVSMPTAYPLIPFKVAANKIAQAISGDLDLEETPDYALEVAQETIDAYNPVGGSLIPTPLREPLALAFNKDGLGRPIRPERLENTMLHSSDNVFDHTAETYGGELAMALADTLRTSYGIDTSPENIIYLYELAAGGPGETFERIATVVSKLYKGEKLNINEIPLARKFIGESYEQKVELRNKETLRVLEEIEKDAGSDSAKNGRIARNIIKKVLQAPKDERLKVLNNLIFENKGDINKSVLDKIKQGLQDHERGINPTDRRIKNLPIKSRADFIVKELENKSLDEIRKMINDYRRKKIITDDVIRELRNNEDFQNLFLRKTE